MTTSARSQCQPRTVPGRLDPVDRRRRAPYLRERHRAEVGIARTPRAWRNRRPGHGYQQLFRGRDHAPQYPPGLAHLPQVHLPVVRVAARAGRCVARPGRRGGAAVAGARIDHYGYMDKVVQERGKMDRNLRLALAELATGVFQPDQQGVPELNVGRALSAMGRYQEAQGYFETALSLVLPGLPRRTVLMFITQNCIALGRFQEAATHAQQLREACQNKGLANYLEGCAQRRLGHPELAVAASRRSTRSITRTVFPLRDPVASRTAGLCWMRPTGEAADQMVLLVEQSPDNHLTVRPEGFCRRRKVNRILGGGHAGGPLGQGGGGAHPGTAGCRRPDGRGPVARFGARPQLLAAAIRFGPMVRAGRALEWSARLRAAGMAGACPLLAQALLTRCSTPSNGCGPGSPPTPPSATPRGRHGRTAGPLVPEDRLAAVLAEMDLLDPAPGDRFASAASGARPGRAGGHRS